MMDEHPPPVLIPNFDSDTRILDSAITFQILYIYIYIYIYTANFVTIEKNIRKAS